MGIASERTLGIARERTRCLQYSTTEAAEARPPTSKHLDDHTRRTRTTICLESPVNELSWPQYSTTGVVGAGPPTPKQLDDHPRTISGFFQVLWASQNSNKRPRKANSHTTTPDCKERWDLRKISSKPRKISSHPYDHREIFSRPLTVRMRSAWATIHLRSITKRNNHVRQEECTHTFIPLQEYPKYKTNVYCDVYYIAWRNITNHLNFAR